MIIDINLDLESFKNKKMEHQDVSDFYQLHFVYVVLLFFLISYNFVTDYRE